MGGRTRTTLRRHRAVIVAPYSYPVAPAQLIGADEFTATTQMLLQAPPLGIAPAPPRYYTSADLLHDGALATAASADLLRLNHSCYARINKFRYTTHNRPTHAQQVRTHPENLSPPRHAAQRSNKEQHTKRPGQLNHPGLSRASRTFSSVLRAR